MKKILFLVVLVAIAGCSKKQAPDPSIAACPEKTVAVMQENQRFFSRVVVGETSASDLRSLKGLRRQATLTKDGDKLDIVFYQTGLPRCPWMVGGEALTPVVVKDGVIAAMGTQQVKDEYTAKGWVIEEAAWPWQRYDFGYLPLK